VATSLILSDGAGNTSAEVPGVTLSGESIDANSPAISSVGVPGNATYDVGQTMTFTVNFDGTGTVGGTNDSTLELVLTSGTVQAAYDSHTATSITYAYTVQSGDLDGDGIAVNALNLNSNTVTDAAGNALDATLGGVGNTSSVLVDGVGPSVSLSLDNATPAEATTDTVTITATLSEAYSSDVVVNLSYDGTATGGGTDYTDGSAAITITAGQTTGTTSVTVVDDGDTDANETIVVGINSVTNGTENGVQEVTATIQDDDAPPTDTSIVVFDLVGGTSSDHDGGGGNNREFESGVAYTIYIRVDSDSHLVYTDANSGTGTWGKWSGAGNLGSDDTIILVGDNSPNHIQAWFKSDVTRTDKSANAFFWGSLNGSAAFNYNSGKLSRKWETKTDTTALWSGNWGSNPNIDNTKLTDCYLVTMPVNVMTTQGLA
jgi:hypothetical protein